MSYNGGTGIAGPRGITGWTAAFGADDRIVYKDENFALDWSDMTEIRELVKSSPVMLEAMEQFITTYKLLKKDKHLDGS